MKIKLDTGAYKPLRAHSTDAGMDLRAMQGVRIPPHGSALVRTGVHIELPKGNCGLLVSKSGLNTKKNITTTGLIDEGFVGEILVKMYNHGEDSYMVMAGDKITQLVVLPCMYEPIEIVEELDANTERGNNGYGSTGR